MVGSRRSVVTSAMLSRTVFITSGVQHVTSGSVDYTGKTSTGRSVFVIINGYNLVFQIATSVLGEWMISALKCTRINHRVLRSSR